MNYFAERWKIHDCKKINRCTRILLFQVRKIQRKRRKFAAHYFYMKIKEGLFKLS